MEGSNRMTVPTLMTPLRGRRASTPREETRRKNKRVIKGQRTKPPIPPRAIDALIGDEEQNRKQKKKKNRKRGHNPATLDHSVVCYDPHGSYGGLGVKEV